MRNTIKLLEKQIIICRQLIAANDAAIATTKNRNVVLRYDEESVEEQIVLDKTEQALSKATLKQFRAKYQTREYETATRIANRYFPLWKKWANKNKLLSARVLLEDLKTKK